jgi:hypothetical protein
MEGGVRGGRDKQCSTNIDIDIGMTVFIATTPSYRHPSSPEEGTTEG